MHRAAKQAVDRRMGYLLPIETEAKLKNLCASGVDPDQAVCQMAISG
jgi:hypothetical protein